MNAKDSLAKSYSYFGPTFRSQHDKQIWIDTLYGKGTPPELDSVKVSDVSGNQATAAAEGHYDDYSNRGQLKIVSTSVTWKMVKENGQWKLDEIVSSQDRGLGDF